MSENLYTRTTALLGETAVDKLKNAHVAIFGVGGVGSFAAEAIARAGISHITLVDGDVVGASNLNRQLVALTSTLGKPKTEVMKARILDINPNATVTTHHLFFDADTCSQINFSVFHHVIDAIDSVASKVLLISNCFHLGVPIVSALSAGNKLSPHFLVDDIFNTSVCPLARVLRPRLKKEGVTKLKVVYSKEEPFATFSQTEHEPTTKRRIPASISYVPASMGLVLAGEVIQSLAEVNA